MPILTTSTKTTLSLNSSHDPSIPPEGLVLEGGIATPVTTAQAAYLRQAAFDGVTVADVPSPKLPAPSTPTQEK